MLLSLLIDLAQAAEPAPSSGFTVGEMWSHAGIPAKTVIVLLALMLLGCTFVAVERLIAFSRARNQSMQIAASIVGPLRANDIAAAAKVAKDERFKASYLASLLRAGLVELEGRADRHGVDNAHRAVDKVTGEELAKLKRGFAILATTGSTAPFVGLFGTTVGVINAFQGMSAGAGLSTIGPGIAEALATTALGIAVAIVGVWMYNYFNHRIEKVTEELASSTADFFDWAEKLLQAREPQAEAGK